MNELLAELHLKYSPLQEGKLASYIPELARAIPDDFAIAVMTVEGETFHVGAANKNFTMQSVSKPFIYGLALEDLGREFLLSKVGVEPTGDAFNSIIELEKKSHRPYNPMINSGAIALSSFLKGSDQAEKLRRILQMFENYLTHPVHVDVGVFLSEKKTAHRNNAIAHLLRHFDVIDSDIDEALDLYFQQCSIMTSTLDLASMAATLANGGIQPVTKKVALKSEYVRDLLSLMLSCGMYDSAGEWAYSVGLPAKSGVSGGLLAVVPGKLGIAAYSPLLDERGHSVRAFKAIQEISERLNLHIFSR